MTGIRGGGVGHAKWVVRKKKEEDALKNVKVVVLVLGGNDFCERGPNGVARVAMGKAELEEWMRGMVEWMLEELLEVEGPLFRHCHLQYFVCQVVLFFGSLIIFED